MNETQIIDIARDGVMTMILVAGPILVVGLVVGLLVTLIQTVTSLQEQTLTFVPKLLATFFSLIFLLPFMMHEMTDFMQRMMDNIIALP
ncbi:flagellar biosynthesis protein FliQ [Insolitispirillum peregrinum]|uniref:Flagellar biosynthetic protein FliQ n=1 Tax=Insolitispirillum peregrinum TaxID=80876 RepID=A0A1N7NJC6_9PROT|nr:flagellar biosynthesis protein FliQ [Insolitispirillum peregrinum]SIS98412.1 flagellar biosynthetic protein FliQ [Insolitispirillum peregrinum]